MRGVKGSGRAGNRTQNLAIKSRLLCQLSYSSVPPGRLRGRETSGRPSALKNYLLRCPPARGRSAKGDLPVLRSIRFFGAISAGQRQQPHPAPPTPDTGTCDLILLDGGHPPVSASATSVRVPAFPMFESSDIVFMTFVGTFETRVRSHPGGRNACGEVGFDESVFVFEDGLDLAEGIIPPAPARREEVFSLKPRPRCAEIAARRAATVAIEGHFPAVCADLTTP